MPVMHEHMHQRTSEQRQPDEHTENMGAMFGEQQRAGDDGKSDEYQRRARGRKAALWPFIRYANARASTSIAPVVHGVCRAPICFPCRVVASDLAASSPVPSARLHLARLHLRTHHRHHSHAHMRGEEIVGGLLLLVRQAFRSAWRRQTSSPGCLRAAREAIAPAGQDGLPLSRAGCCASPGLPIIDARTSPSFFAFARSASAKVFQAPA